MVKTFLPLDIKNTINMMQISMNKMHNALNSLRGSCK